MPGWFNRHHESVSQERDEIKAQNVLILQNQARIIAMSSSVSAEIATLATDVTVLTAAVNAAVTGFATLSAQIAALEASGGLSADDAASLTASVNTVATETAALAAATPAAPVAPAP